MDNWFAVFAIAFATFSFWFSICNLMWHYQSDKIANSSELQQCLSQSWTTWQWGECIIILNQK